MVGGIGETQTGVRIGEADRPAGTGMTEGARARPHRQMSGQSQGEAKGHASSVTQQILAVMPLLGRCLGQRLGVDEPLAVKHCFPEGLIHFHLLKVVLTGLLRDGSRQLLAQAIKAEVEVVLIRYGNKPMELALKTD